MSSNNRIDFNEPMSELINRLEVEHKEFELNLAEISTNVQKNNIVHATEILRGISEKIIWHAVEEEARLMRVIMARAKEDSAESIKIMQEHNWVIKFFNNRLAMLEKLSASPRTDEYVRVKDDLNEFVNNLRNHFREEEQIVFPLALKLERTK